MMFGQNGYGESILREGLSMAKEAWREAVDEIWKLFRETREQMQETREQMQETREQMQETDRRMRETDREITRLTHLFESQWGKLVEALVAPGTAALFRERGIDVKYVSQRVRVRDNGRHMEIDYLLENDDEIVIVEVKTTLGVDDVRDFLKDLEEFLDFFPKYRDYHIYGAVAAVNIEGEADRFAYRRGLFVLGLVGDGLVRILNDASFKPMDFGASQPADTVEDRETREEENHDEELKQK
jgi:hypothetical protein